MFERDLRRVVLRIGDNESNRSAMMLDYSATSGPFDAFRRVSIHILRMLYISAGLYIEWRIG